MEKTPTLIITHHKSGYEFLNQVLGKHPRISANHTGFLYGHPIDLLKTSKIIEEQNITNRFRQLFADTLLYNHTFTCPALYKLCKFIYLVRSPEAAISEMVASKQYEPDRAVNYYRFRLQRLAQMAKETPGAIMLTWEDLNAEGFRLIDNYLGLKMPLNIRNEQVSREFFYEIPENLLRPAEKAYEKYTKRMRQWLKTT